MPGLPIESWCHKMDKKGLTIRMMVKEEASRLSHQPNPRCMVQLKLPTHGFRDYCKIGKLEFWKVATSLKKLMNRTIVSRAKHSTALNHRQLSWNEPISSVRHRNTIPDIFTARVLRARMPNHIRNSWMTKLSSGFCRKNGTDARSLHHHLSQVHGSDVIFP